jgi:hypothetical protein
VIEGTDPLPSKPSVLSEFAERFDTWVEDGRLEEKTKKFYRNGWRLLKATPVAGLRVDQITGDFVEQLKFPASASNANCALRTLRRMLHKAEEWKMIGHTPKIKMMKDLQLCPNDSVPGPVPFAKTDLHLTLSSSTLSLTA